MGDVMEDEEDFLDEIAFVATSIIDHRRNGRWGRVPTTLKSGGDYPCRFLIEPYTIISFQDRKKNILHSLKVWNSNFQIAYVLVSSLPLFDRTLHNYLIVKIEKNNILHSLKVWNSQLRK